MKYKLTNWLRLLLFLSIIPGWLFSAITKGPYLNNPQEDSMTIMWECDNDKPVNFAYWQENNNKNKQIVIPFSHHDSFYLYRVKINGLMTDNKYNYMVVTQDGNRKQSHFYTNPLKNQSFKFIVIGDSRTGHDIFSSILSKVDSLSPRLIINMGDLVNRGYKFEQWSSQYFTPAQNIINHIPLIPTLGDHETSNEIHGRNYYYFFRQGINTDSVWFSYNFGDIHFISLDYRRENETGMIKWFKNDLKNCNTKWKIVYLHRPSYNVGGHRSHWGAPLWQKLFREYKIDIVFAGHSHLYERFYPMRPAADNNAWPVTYITTGGAGAELYNAVDNDYLAVSKSANHYLVGSVSGDTLKFTAKLLDGNTLDHFEIVKHNGKYDADYLNLVKDQDVMDIYMTFASKLLVKFNEIPTQKTPAKKMIRFDTSGLPGSIPFKLFLSKETAEYYKIEPFKGVLKSDSDYKDEVVLYAKDEVKIDGKYFIPPIIFNVAYKYKDKDFIVKGRQSRYYPPKKEKYEKE